MITHLVIGETPLEALARHGKAIPPKKVKSYIKKKKAEENMDVDKDPEKEAAAAKAKHAIDTITEAASRLSDRGVDDSYDQPREMLMRLYKRETGSDWKDPNPPQWEFHWLNAPEDQINGPYDADTMKAWHANGQLDAGAEYRRVGDLEWSQLPDFD